MAKEVGNMDVVNYMAPGQSRNPDFDGLGGVCLCRAAFRRSQVAVQGLGWPKA